jgi:hypothetical protein
VTARNVADLQNELVAAICGPKTRGVNASYVPRSKVSVWSYVKYISVEDSDEKTGRRYHRAARHFPVHCAVDFPELVYIAVLSEQTVTGTHDSTSVSASQNNLYAYVHTGS